MKHFCIILSIAIVLSGLAGLVRGQDEDIALRVAIQDDIRSTNPFTSSDYYTEMVTQWLYDCPIFYDFATEIVYPYIAVGSAEMLSNSMDWDECRVGSFEYVNGTAYSANPVAVIFYDFTDVKWHDGEQMDIRDVLFSYHAAAQYNLWAGDIDCLKDVNYSNNNLLHIEKCWESADGLKSALEFTLQKPYCHFFDRTLAIRLLPEHVWTSKASGQSFDDMKIWCDPEFIPYSASAWSLADAQEFDNPEPIGSGRFKWGAWGQGQLIRLEAWNQHFLQSEFAYYDLTWDCTGLDAPHFDIMEFNIYKTTESAVLALKNGYVDIVGWGIPTTFVQDLANEPGVALQQSPEPGFYYLGYNMRRKSFGYDENGTDAGRPLRDAIAYCIDKNRIVQRLLLWGIGGEGPVSSIDKWFNETIPRYSFDPDRAIEILEDAGYMLDYPDLPPGNGNYWKNPDGSEIGSGYDGVIEILAPEPIYDPIRAQTSVMLAAQLKEVGINAEFYNDWSFGWSRIENRNFDMFIELCHIDSDPSVYMYDFFHSDNAVYGQNYAGYQNASYDQAIELARSASNDSLVKKYVMDAQACIAFDKPYDVLAYRTRIEAYRSSRFNGWCVGPSGSIFNECSVYNIRPLGPYKVKAQFVSPPSAMTANSTVPIYIFVKDQDGVPLSGAMVELNASMGKLGTEIGITSTEGKFTTYYTAPWVNPNDDDAVANGSKVIIQIRSATYSMGDYVYDPAPSVLTLITVYPVDVPFLSVTLKADPDVIDPDYNNNTGEFGFTQIEVMVRDQGGGLVQGATVGISVSPAIPTLSPATSLTDENGIAIFYMTAVDEPEDDNSTRNYEITAYAQSDDPTIKPGDNSIIITVVDRADAPPPSSSAVGYLDHAIIIISLFAASVCYAVFRKLNP